ncbi:MAG: hypothetical protein JWM87_709 [Candidatus Eremiobacteraeota bacterium]|nr:hypothetical protein [Candidatus Eremiobacteraeota bacterium]
MHDAIRDLSRGQTLDDLLDETERIAADGVVAARARFRTAAELDVLATAMGAVEVIDGTTGPRIVIPREPRIVRSITIEEADAAGPADYGVTSPDAVIAREDARHGGFDGDPDQVPGSTYADLEECAAGKRRVRGASGGDQGPKARRTGGAGSMAGPTKVSQENWDHERGVTGGKVRPVVVGARVTHESKDVLDADQSASNGEVMESVAIVMRKTGRTKQQVLDELSRLAETGMIDPDVADALPTPVKSSAA